MQIVYYPGDFPEACLTASPAEFAAMAGRIAELVRVGVGEMKFFAPNSLSPDETTRVTSAVVVSVGSGPALVTVSGDGNLTVTGGLESIKLFGLNMPAEASLPPGYHVHFEHAGRESFVAAESVPLVMLVGSIGDVHRG